MPNTVHRIKIKLKIVVIAAAKNATSSKVNNKANKSKPTSCKYFITPPHKIKAAQGG